MKTNDCFSPRLGPRFFLAILAPLVLGGCLAAKPELATRMQDGKPVYETTCDVHQGTLGRKAMFGKNRGEVITPANACPAVKATCPTGSKVLDLKQGPPEYRVERINTGRQIITQRFYIRKTTVTYQCQV